MLKNREATGATRNIVSDDRRRDPLIEWLKTMMHHSFVLDMPETYAATWETFEKLVAEDRASDSGDSRLRTAVPSIGMFHTELPTKAAWLRYDAKYCASGRRFVPPSFNEIRHTLNLAQVMAVAPELELVSFDGDQTLYSDGGNFEDDELARVLIGLLQHGVRVVVLTAAGYGHDGPKYEARLAGLLRHFRSVGLSHEEMARFFVIGGECNYVLSCNAQAQLERVPDWKMRPLIWDPPEAEVSRVLDIAEATINTAIDDLQLRAKIIRKSRGIGLIPGGDDGMRAQPQGHGSLKLKYEALDEVAMRVQEELRMASPRLALPYCAFNGGRDAWIDVGNKAIGMEVMQSLLGVPASRSLHVGDQFLRTGNDIAARSVAPCIWIISPSETKKILEHLSHLRGMALPDLPGASTGAKVEKPNVYTGEGLGEPNT